MARPKKGTITTATDTGKVDKNPVVLVSVRVDVLFRLHDLETVDYGKVKVIYDSTKKFSIDIED